MVASRQPPPLKPSIRQSGFNWKSFDVPHSLVSRTLGGLLILATVASGAAWWIGSGLTERQIAGSARVVQSLDAEANAIEEHWQGGGVPAVALEAEEERIKDELQQEQAQLAELQKPTNG